MNSATDHPFHTILNPRSVAIAGASNNFLKMGTVQALTLLNQGFPGEVYFIHPSESAVLDRPTFKTPHDLPEPVDLAILIVPTKVVAPLLDQFGERGVRHAIIVSGGFREMGSLGGALEAEVVAIARKHQIRFVGPNCIGVINRAAALNCTYFPDQSPPNGRVGLISQSGTYVTQVLDWLRWRNLGMGLAVSVGNQADLDVADALEYFGAQDHIQAIALYLEGLVHGERFVATARRVVQKKPIVALYAGGSQAGARASASHTGALAAPDELYDGIFQQCGILRVASVLDLYRQTWTLAHQPPMRGPRVGIVTHSGGPAATIADGVERQGLDLPAFSPALQADLMKDLPPTAQAENPVDMTYLLQLDLLSDSLPAKVLASGEVDGLIIHGLPGKSMGRLMYVNLTRLLPEGTTYDQFVGLIAAQDALSPLLEMPERFKRPVVTSAFNGPEDEVSTRLHQAGIPAVESPEQTATLLGRLHASWQMVERVRRGSPYDADLTTPPPPTEVLALLRNARRRQTKTLAEYEAKSLVRAYGIPVIGEVLVRNAEDAAKVAAAMKGAVSLKLSAAGLAHKTEIGGIRLNLSGDREVRNAANQLLQLGGRLSDLALLVAPMLEDPREFVAGMVRHPAFPTMVMFGWGGIFTETLRDTTWRLAPVDPEEAKAMFMETRAGQLLGKYRGLPAVATDALADLLITIGEIGRTHSEIAAIDLNPILIDSAGKPLVVDALVELA